MSKKVITANQAAAWGAYLARSQMIAAYPITPQTSIIETLASLMLSADWKYKFMNVESEHSVMAACISASLAGARVFTATSSQGLLLMHELLHWTSYGRLPVVMVDVNRAIAPGWNIWTDQQDSLSQRDTGWIQIYCANAQEVLDCVICAYQLAETVQIPVMVVLDAFYLSHTAEAVDIPTLERVDSFLKPRKPAFKIEVGRPESFGEFLKAEEFQSMRYKLSQAFEEVFPQWDLINEAWSKIFGRENLPVETYRAEDAEAVLVTSGTPSSTARVVVDQMRKEGFRVGLVRLRFVRPFPSKILRRLLSGVSKVAVLDRSFSWGTQGILCQELSAALYPLGKNQPKIYGYVYGLGGVDITTSIIENIFKSTMQEDQPKREYCWVNQEIKEKIEAI